MRLFYCDPGLSTDIGHHAQSCRALVGEARRRGIETHVFAAVDIAQTLREELGTRPAFRVSPYWRTDGDPICGWLNAFGVSAQTTLEDLRHIGGEMRHDDLLYLNSGQAAQVMALSMWLTESPIPARAALEFGIDPGLDLVASPTGPLQAQIRDPRVDPSGVLYRYAARQITPAVASRLSLLTFDSTSSEMYRQLLERPVEVAPVPRGRTVTKGRRAADEPATVALLGHQRGEKGYHLVPEIFEALARRFACIRLLAHNSRPEFMVQEQASIRELAARDSRVVVDERVADARIWDELLAQSDLILCPYDPSRFALSYSAVASEAVANGIPLVVPAGTTLARVVSDYGAGTAFEQWNAATITEATAVALENLDAFTTQAAVGAERWAQHHGPAACLTALLRLLGVE